MSEKRPRVVIEIDGGLVQDVCSDVPIDVIILDYDVEGCDDDRVKTLDFMVDPREAYVSWWEPDPKYSETRFIEELWDFMEKDDGETDD